MYAASAAATAAARRVMERGRGGWEVTFVLSSPLLGGGRFDLWYESVPLHI